MHHFIFIRPKRLLLTVLVVSSLCLAGSSYGVAQPPPSWANLLTLAASVEQPPQGMATSSGIQVKVHSKALTRGTPQLHIQTFDGQVLRANLDHLSWNGQGVITWEGRVSALGVSCPVLLSAHDGRVVGVIETPGGRYEVLPTAGGHTLKKVDSPSVSGCRTLQDQLASVQ